VKERKGEEGKKGRKRRGTQEEKRRNS